MILDGVFLKSLLSFFVGIIFLSALFHCQLAMYLL